jgi:hypothetical protein
VEFFEILNNSKDKKLMTPEEVKIEETANLPQIKNNNPSQINKPKTRKTENSVQLSRKTSDNLFVRDKKERLHFEKDCLDLDDLVQAELPTEYFPEKHEEKMKCLGDDLIVSRKVLMKHLRDNKSEYVMSNDDYNLFLCLLRKKKEKMIEREHPYYVDYNIKLEDVYLNEKDEKLGMSPEKEFDIADFVKKYIDSDGIN